MSGLGRRNRISVQLRSPSAAVHETGSGPDWDMAVALVAAQISHQAHSGDLHLLI